VKKPLCWLHVWKFSSPKNAHKNHIPNLPIGVIVRNKRKNHFTTSNFDTLPRIENLLFQYEIFGYVVTFTLITSVENFKSKRSTKKHIYQIYLHVLLWEKKGKLITTSNFNTLPRIQFLLTHNEILATRSSLCRRIYLVIKCALCTYDEFSPLHIYWSLCKGNVLCDLWWTECWNDIERKERNIVMHEC
jgi:hypothetical protein